jgi:peptidoglycan/LPS O-acetylase OafA/YrhL
LAQSLQQRGYSWISSSFLQFTQWIASILEGKGIQGNINALDGVRAIACLSVVMLHINLITTRDIQLWTPQSIPSVLSALAFAGDTGVTLFFILSGFLLFQPYAKSLLFDDAAWPSARQFYLRRALRILPVYYISLLLMVIIFRPAYFQVGHLRDWVFFLTMFMDSSATTYKQINGPFWTLAVEWQFYLILPWLALGISWLVRRGSLRRRVSLLIASLGIVATWGILTRFLGVYLSGNPGATFILPWSVMHYILPFIYGPTNAGLHGKFLEDFATGMLISSLFILAQRLSREYSFHRVMQQYAPWLLVLGLTWLTIMAMWKFNTNQPHTWSFFDPLNGAYNIIGEFGFALGYGFCVTAVLFGQDWLKRPFEWAPLRWIGVISYGVYMWHLLLLESLTSHVIVNLPDMPGQFFYIFYWLGLFIVVIPFSFLLFALIEKPGMQLGKRFRRSPTYSRNL